MTRARRRHLLPEPGSPRRAGSGHRHRLARLSVIVIVIVAAFGACGATGYRAEREAQVNGAWELRALDPALNHDLIVMTIDTTVMSVEISTGCRSLLGSYTLAADGTAGLSLPGGTTSVCSGAAAQADQAIADHLEAVQHWELIEGRLILRGPEAELAFDRR